MNGRPTLSSLPLRRALMARVLLVVFMAMVGVRTFHTHVCDHPRAEATAKTATAGANDACLLCVLQCLPFLPATETVFHAVVAVSIVAFFFTRPTEYFAPGRSRLTRGPPSVC